MRCPLSIPLSIEGQPLQIWQCSETHALNGEINDMLQWPSQLANMYFMLCLQIYIHLADKHEVISENLQKMFASFLQKLFFCLHVILFNKHLHTICIYACQNHYFKENTMQRIFIKNILSCFQCVVLTNFVDLSGWKTCSQVGKQFYQKINL